MEREGETHQSAAVDAANGKKHGRGWTERISGPIRYRRYTTVALSGPARIFFQLEPEPGSDRIDDAAVAYVKDLKKLHCDNDLEKLREAGMDISGEVKTGLKSAGKGQWSFPDNPIGRVAADVLDSKLRELAHERERGR